MQASKNLRGATYWSTLGGFATAHALFLNYLLTGKIASWGAKTFVSSGANFAFLLAAVYVVPAGLKHILVFWRLSDPLPGNRAFSEIAPGDPRINMNLLKQKVGKLPRNPREQNSLWYQLYKKLAVRPLIFTLHSHFLTLRDAAALQLIFLPLVPSVTLAIRGPEAAAGALAVELGLFLFFATAARNVGKRFVASVLSEYCSSKEEAKVSKALKRKSAKHLVAMGRRTDRNLSPSFTVAQEDQSEPDGELGKPSSETTEPSPSS